jgi:predicted DNA-binding protein (UPF0251 family)
MEANNASNASTDSNRIELSPTEYEDNQHYVVSQEKSGTYTVYVMNADDWDKLPISGDGPSYVFDGDLEEYGANLVNIDPCAIETYDLATLADELNKIESGEVGVMSDRFWETIWDAEPREAVYVGEHPGYNNADNRPRVEIYEIAGHVVLNVEDAGETRWYLIDGEDEYSQLYDSIYSDVDYTVSEFADFGRNLELETVGMIADKVARDIAGEFENVEYEPRETYLSDQEYEAWFLTRVRGRSYESAANTMGVGVETVKTYISRVSKKRQKARNTLALVSTN